MRWHICTPMYDIVVKSRFKRDYDLMRRRGLPMAEIDAVIAILAAGVPLPPQYRDHALTGDYAHCRECHIRPDWLLVYSIDDAILQLILIRTGSHSDLF